MSLNAQQRWIFKALAAGASFAGTPAFAGCVVDASGTFLRCESQDPAGETFNGDIQGTLGVTYGGPGTLIFTGTNTYSGDTVLSGFLLATPPWNYRLMVGPQGIGDMSAVIFDHEPHLRSFPPTLQLNADETVGSLAGYGNLTGPFTLTTGGNNSTTVLGGSIIVDGVRKVGEGTFLLTGNGTLSSGFAVDAGTLTVGGIYTTASNSVAGGATLEVRDRPQASPLNAGMLVGYVVASAGSTMIVNGTVYGNIASAGALSGTGTVNGVLTNTGILNTGNAGTGIFQVNGSYVQSPTGVLAVDITPNNVAGTGYDQLSVTGTAALAGTLALAPNGTGATAASYVQGATYDVVRATGGISGSLLVTGNSISPYVRLEPTGVVALAGTDQVFRLTVVRTPYAMVIGGAGTANQLATANGFQGLATGASEDAAALVASVDLMTIPEAQRFFDEASPELYGAYGRTLLDQGNLFTRQVYLQMHEAKTDNQGSSVWARAYGLWGKGGGDDFRFGSGQDIWGIAAGVDHSWDNFVVGIAGGWSRGKVDYALGNSSGDSKSWQVGAYGGYFAGPLSVDLQLAYVNGNMDASRSINVAGVVRSADATPDGSNWKVVATAGYGFNVAGMVLRPFIGIDWSIASIDSFTERGAGAASLTLEKLNGDRTDLMLGLEFAANKTSTFSPYGRMVWRHSLDNQHDGITAFFDGNDATRFTVSAVTPADDQIDLDAGLNYAINPSLSIFAGYQGLFRDDLTSHGATAGLRYSFGAAAPIGHAPPAPPSVR